MKTRVFKRKLNNFYNLKIRSKNNKLYFLKYLIIKKINIYVTRFLLIISLIFLSSCKDIFLRFKYQTIECQENSFNLRKISIKNDKVGSFADVQFGDFYHKIEILANDADWIFLGNKELDLEVGIHKDSEIVEVRLKNIIKNLKCEKNIFRM